MFCVCCEVVSAVQVALIRAGRAGEVVAETRGWDDAAQVTGGQRSKEGLADYRFFAEPDLPLLAITEQYLDAVRVRGACAGLAATGPVSPQRRERPLWRMACSEMPQISGYFARRFCWGVLLCRTVPSPSRIHDGLPSMLRPPLPSGRSTGFITTELSVGL